MGGAKSPRCPFGKKIPPTWKKKLVAWVVRYRDCVANLIDMKRLDEAAPASQAVGVGAVYSGEQTYLHWTWMGSDESDGGSEYFVGASCSRW